jgi:hypothetical protein
MRYCAKTALRQTFRNEMNLLKLNNNKIGLNTSLVRMRHSARLNTIVVFVPQQEAWIVERMGRFNKILGINYLLLLLISITI